MAEIPSIQRIIFTVSLLFLAMPKIAQPLICYTKEKHFNHTWKSMDCAKANFKTTPVCKYGLEILRGYLRPDRKPGDSDKRETWIYTPLGCVAKTETGFLIADAVQYCT